MDTSPELYGFKKGMESNRMGAVMWTKQFPDPLQMKNFHSIIVVILHMGYPFRNSLLSLLFPYFISQIFRLAYGGHIFYFTTVLVRERGVYGERMVSLQPTYFCFVFINVNS